MNNSNVPRRRHGFTLIELLVVVSIITLLIALLLPAIKRAKAIAEQVVCLSGLAQLGIGFQVYVEEYDAFPRAYARNNHLWMVDLNTGTFDDTDAFTCPSQGIGPWDGVTVGEGTMRFSYGYNVFGTDGERGLTHYDASSSTLTWRWRIFDDILIPGQMIVLTDSDTHESNPGHSIWDGLVTSPYWVDQIDPTHYTQLLLPGRIHFDSANVLFADGHATHQSWEWFRQDYGSKWNVDGRD